MYSDLLKLPVPTVKKLPSTFFDIGRFSRRETVISNFYAYYFNPEEDHGFGYLFLHAFLDCISMRDFVKTNIRITTEESTTNRRRIDIIIRGLNDNGKESAIIIENKIGADLYNNLNEYYDHIDGDGDKVLVVLSRRRVNLQNNTNNYVNVLHSLFVEKIICISGEYLFNATESNRVILKHFLDNIINWNMPPDMKNVIEFYLKNSEKIKQLAAMQRILIDQVMTDVHEKVLNHCPYEENKLPDYLKYHIKEQGSVKCLKNLNLVIYPFYKKEDSDTVFRVCIEMGNNKLNMERADSLYKELERIIKDKNFSLNKMSENKSNIVLKDYSWSELYRDPMSNFDNIFQNEWVPVIKAIETVFSQNL